MAISGYARNSKLLLKSNQELSQIDSGLLLIENPCYLAFILPAAIKKALMDLELQYYRLGHLNLDIIKATQDIIKGLIYQKKTLLDVTRLCNPCEKGRPLKFINKKSMCRAMEALARVHINIIYIMPRGLNSENYSILFIDEATSVKWGYTFAIKSEAFDSVKQFNQFC